MNTFNGGPFLREAIDSVIDQTHRDWELIVWDDQSTDNSAEIVKSYADPRIHYFLSPKRTNVGHARHQAFQETKGEWVAFLDQDDVWTADKLEKQLALGRSAPDVGIVYGRTVSFTPSGRKRDFDHRHEFESLPEGPILERLFIDACFISMSSVMLRRTALEELGGIPPDIHVCPDYYMYLGVSQRYTARAVQDVICYYRLHSNNMTPRAYKRVHSECLWLIDRWGATMAPRILSRRRKVHHTLVALEEIRNRQTSEGLLRLLKSGSLSYLFSRPFVRSFRALRRKVEVPNWVRSESAGHRSTPRLQPSN